GNGVGQRRYVLAVARMEDQVAVASRVVLRPQAGTERGIVGDLLAGLVRTVVLVIPQTEVHGQPVAEAPGVVGIERVRLEAGPLGRMEDRIELDERGAVAEENGGDVGAVDGGRGA